IFTDYLNSCWTCFGFIYLSSFDFYHSSSLKQFRIFINIADNFFKSPFEKKLSEQKANTVHFGEIFEQNEIIDEVLVSVFHAPHSYTGENSVEISCHGSVYIQQKILQTAINSGARMADAGEYTLRAFLNGKLDLSQAEAVADLISSNSEAARRVAMSQLKGGFSQELQHLRSELVNFTSLVELELDFSEEDVEFADRKQLFTLIDEIKNKLSTLKNSFQYGNAIKNGIPVAIIGQPNVGKSTLLNALLHEDKALVSDIAGTTRDSIEDIISINGVLFRFIDTAGLRHTDDTIENLGIERTIEKVKKAEVILYLIDVSVDRKPELYSKIMPYLDNKKLIIVLNKIDKAKIKLSNQDFKNTEIIEISAKLKTNLKKLENALLKAINFDTFNQNDIIITNTRHYEALSKSHEAALKVIDALNQNIYTDLLAFDIREMLHFLGEITGEITNDEILGNIFKNFCIGK
ncbi:MAG: tRNA uridine-5-carboxymethylaminomethyl(34) synthesis GTPase MnmE, partial [Bacteroidota bacterium]|nr:tRNA uridine-5-carboxymethylaminomethyl(34) synthesis GTPase MnmE [Bacteroidota bacterium]